MTDRQGSIIPTIYIGMGGTGSRIVDRIAARAKLLPNWESQLSPLTHFVAVDTNELDQHRLVHVPRANRIHIAGFDKARVVDGYRRSNNPKVKDWLDETYSPRPGYKPGAGQIRVESRLGFFHRSPAIRQKLESVVSAALEPNVTWRQSSPPKFYVYLYATLAGGTGSGAFLSMAYLINDVIRARQWQPRVISHLLLSTLLVEKVDTNLHPAIHSNTYAALKELEHLNKLRYDEVRREGRKKEDFVYWHDERNVTLPSVEKGPFFISFLYDRPPHASIRDFQGAIADASFLQNFTPLMDEVAGEFDNFEKEAANLTRFPGRFRDLGQGFCKDYGAMGVAALVLPRRDFTTYCALRYAAEAIRSQITFGRAESAPSDARSLALARLAVDYSDPRFRQMSEAARLARINESFVESVQEMERQDVNEKLTDGFWATLVEQVDRGKLLGVEENGEERRGQGLLDRVAETLSTERRSILSKINIQMGALVFHRETVNAYLDKVKQLKDSLREARSVISSHVPGIRIAAEQGEYIRTAAETIADGEGQSSGLSPLQERYLVLRLLDLVQNEWLPAAELRLDRTAQNTLEHPKVMERVDETYYTDLLEASKRKRMLRADDAGFLAVRDDVQEAVNKHAKGTQANLEADLEVGQLRSLLDYLRRRARQYARLSIRMDELVSELEARAERMRKREDGEEIPWTLQTEVFELLEEPRERIWGQVYEHLFLEGERFMQVFDRQALANTISAQLEPKQVDGRVLQKNTEELVHDIREAVLALGRERLQPTLEGGPDDLGLDVATGLELEARLVLGDASPTAVQAYIDRKLVSLDQLSGLLARVDLRDSSAFQDGVVPNHRRRVAVPGADGRPLRHFQRLATRLQEKLSRGDLNVNVVPSLEDPCVVLAHEVGLLVPIYYFSAVLDVLEGPYQQVAANDRRGYDLHTDSNWEKTLPNLNPRAAEFGVSWALTALVRGMACGLFEASGKGLYLWHSDGDQIPLGDNLSAVLYRLSNLHSDPEVGIDQELATQRSAIGEVEYRAGLNALADWAGSHIKRMARQDKLGQGLSRRELLERPILRAIVEQAQMELDKEPPPKAETSGPAGFSRRGRQD